MRKVRCYAERIGPQWQAFCVDLNLAVQADTLPEVKAKLGAMMHSYIKLAKEQNDPQHQRDMLYRAAPLSIQLRYWYVRGRIFLDSIRKHSDEDKFEVIPARQLGYC